VGSVHSKQNSMGVVGSVHSKQNSVAVVESVHSKQNSIAVSDDYKSASASHARIISITSEEQDQNPKYISAKEFETLIKTKPFDEVLENVMKAYSLGDLNSWPEQSSKSTKHSSQMEERRL
jgi:hypothetical protein